MASMTSLPFNGGIGANDATGAIGTIVAIGIIVALGAIVSLYDKYIIMVSNGLSLLPMLPLSPLVTIGAINICWIF